MNARSLINKFDSFQAVVNVLCPDVIGITESWATQGILDAELQLIGYDMFRSDRGTAHRGGGVLLYVNSVHKPSEYHVKTIFSDNVWCKVGDLLIGVCYRSENYAIVGSNNDDRLYELIKEVGDRHVLLMGDFNFPDIDWAINSVNASENSDCRRFFNCLEDLFLTQHVLQPTRGNSVLDLILTREPDLVSKVKVIDNLDSSDHNMI